MSVSQGSVRRWLDNTYTAGGVLAALFLIAILIIIVLQMIARWAGVTFPGATNYAGYSMASASFFAFAYTLNNGTHIRVSILLNAVGKWRRGLEIWCFGIGATISTYFAYYAVKGTYFSWNLNDISQGQDALPLWVPQLAMSAGTVLLALCFWDNLVRIVVSGNHGIKTHRLEADNSE